MSPGVAASAGLLVEGIGHASDLVGCTLVNQVIIGVSRTCIVRSSDGLDPPEEIVGGIGQVAAIPPKSFCLSHIIWRRSAGLLAVGVIEIDLDVVCVGADHRSNYTRLQELPQPVVVFTDLVGGVSVDLLRRFGVKGRRARSWIDIGEV